MNWIERNEAKLWWIVWFLIVAAPALVGSGWLVAHAQKPDSAPLVVNRRAVTAGCATCGKIGFSSRKQLDDYIDDHVRQHCVAVLMNDDTFKIAEGASYTAPKVEYGHDKDGNRIAHVPKQTLKLECK